MNLPPCHSRRILSDEDQVYLCAHPTLRTAHDLVTPAVCKSCRLQTGPPPPHYRSLLSWPEHRRQRGDLQLVIARYRENVDWRHRFQGIPTIVYEKGERRGAYRLPNIGREAHTYLHHIVTHYGHLAPLTVFLQGDPYSHVADLEDKLWNLSPDVGFQDLCDHVLVEDGDGHPIQPGLGLREIYQALFDEPAPDFFLCHSAACFAVSRENVLRRPRTFYEKARDLVVSRELGPWEIERLWQTMFQTRAVRQGVVTAADAGFFGELRLFVMTYREWNSQPLVVVDLGLSEEQRNWCRKQPGLALHRMPSLCAPAEQMRKQPWWQTWLKPFLIYHVPLDRVLWIDADCTIHADVAPVLESLDQQPFLIRDGTTAVTENRPELYRYLTLPPEVRTGGVNVNGGVVGLCKIRDRALLNAWAYGVAWAAGNADKQALSAWADQGILLWALHRTGRTDCIQSDLTWNCPAGDSCNLIATALRDGQSILKEIERRYPHARIVHWLGVYKLARQLDAELERLFLRGPARDGTVVRDPSESRPCEGSIDER